MAGLHRKAADEYVLSGSAALLYQTGGISFGAPRRARHGHHLRVHLIAPHSAAWKGKSIFAYHSRTLLSARRSFFIALGRELSLWCMRAWKWRGRQAGQAWAGRSLCSTLRASALQAGFAVLRRAACRRQNEHHEAVLAQHRREKAILWAARGQTADVTWALAGYTCGALWRRHLGRLHLLPLPSRLVPAPRAARTRLHAPPHACLYALSRSYARARALARLFSAHSHQEKSWHRRRLARQRLLLLWAACAGGALCAWVWQALPYRRRAHTLSAPLRAALTHAALCAARSTLSICAAWRFSALRHSFKESFTRRGRRAAPLLRACLARHCCLDACRAVWIGVLVARQRIMDRFCVRVSPYHLRMVCTLTVLHAGTSLTRQRRDGGVKLDAWLPGFLPACAPAWFCCGWSRWWTPHIRVGALRVLRGWRLRVCGFAWRRLDRVFDPCKHPHTGLRFTLHFAGLLSLFWVCARRGLLSVHGLTITLCLCG